MFPIRIVLPEVVLLYLLVWLSQWLFYSSISLVKYLCTRPFLIAPSLYILRICYALYVSDWIISACPVVFTCECMLMPIYSSEALLMQWVNINFREYLLMQWVNINSREYLLMQWVNINSREYLLMQWVNINSREYLFHRQRVLCRPFFTFSICNSTNILQ